MRAYEIRPEGVRARVDDSADSMKHRSLTEEEGEKGGRAHRRGRIPRFSILPNGPVHGRRSAACCSGRRDAGTRIGYRHRNARGTSYLISTLAPCSSRAALILSASSLATPSLTGLGAASTRSLASLRPRPVSSRTTLMTGVLLGPTSVSTALNSVCSSAAAAGAAAAGAATATAAG